MTSDPSHFDEPMVRDPKIGRPSLREADIIDVDLLATTWRLFVDQGYSRTTIEAVARHARMSKRTIYQRYSSKDQLVEAAIRDALERWRSHVRASLTNTTSSSEDWLGEFVRRCLEILVAPEGSALMGFLLTEDETFRTIRETVSASVRQSVEVFSTLLAQRTPGLSEQLAEDLSLAVLDLLIGFATRLNALQPHAAMDEIRTRGPRFTAVIRSLVDARCLQAPA
ncbi:TetR/AcrR family transcriptional regulator [Brevundimonas sp.]|jgi:AcrR family transcriptional regulator|uniref:TetR/AcrR family transcriptional regulator n=1 Tax=Brevundimonas sp. TaxID=1871086 RepID=UPI0019CAE32D|nr:TetR/AcrR family transcriptional regulator [Brevundimonas sp.]MBD3836127.1 TetR/AcrR family transcriptional regulator [Brevundimonas sp.]